MCTLHFVMVHILWCCTLCDVYVLKTLCFGTLMLCAATFCNITSCDVYVALRYVATSYYPFPGPDHQVVKNVVHCTVYVHAA